MTGEEELAKAKQKVFELQERHPVFRRFLQAMYSMNHEITDKDREEVDKIPDDDLNDFAEEIDEVVRIAFDLLLMPR